MSDTLGAAALHRIRVVDACTQTGGAYAAMLLAEQGADVVKVELPGGDPSRGTDAFAVLNRSKRAVTIDLASDDGHAALQRLVASADVLLYDSMPDDGHAATFDVAWARVANPRLIAGYLPAYGSRGPYAGLPPDEALIQAVSGVADAQFRYDTSPVYVNIPIAGYSHGIVAAGAVAASLYARERSGWGDGFELSAMGAIFAMQTVAYLRAENVVRLAGRAGPRGGIPTYRLVKASDDWLFAGALTPPFWASLAVAAGLEDCLVDPRFTGAPMGIADMEARAELAARIDAAFAERPRDEWLRILEEANVPRAPVLSRDEFLLDPQVVHNEMVVAIEDLVLGATRQPGPPVRLHSTPPRAPFRAPARGEHQSLLDKGSAAERGGSGAALPRPTVPRQPRKHPLEGVTIIDLTGFIAGANGSMFLADLGADVIKVEPPDGDGWRTSGLAFMGSNRGKRSLCIDLRTPDGRDVLLDLVERADVVMDNFRAGVMERLGIGYEALRARNSRIIHSSVTGYGSTGPYAHLPGFDPLFQARSGLMRAQGEPGGEPVYLQISLCDYATALTAAFGVMTALVARERTGAGNRVETSLLQSAFTVQPVEFLRYDGRAPDASGGRDLKGRHALYRIYDASDGAITIACTTQAHATALARALSLDAINVDIANPPPPEGEVAEAIAREIACETRAHWARVLPEHGVPAAPCVRVAELFDDPHMSASDLWWDTEHPRWVHVRQTGAVVAWDAMTERLERRAPGLGEHTVECLREFGIGTERIAVLIASGAIVDAAEPPHK